MHTPGPWKVEYHGPFPCVVVRDGGKYDGAMIATEVCNGEANAQLIAAAPEMLKELELAHAALSEGRGYGQSTTANRIRSAIRKAKGK
jgi:hypothetical protein